MLRSVLEELFFRSALLPHPRVSDHNPSCCVLKYARPVVVLDMQKPRDHSSTCSNTHAWTCTQVDDMRHLNTWADLARVSILPVLFFAASHALTTQRPAGVVSPAHCPTSTVPAAHKSADSNIVDVHAAAGTHQLCTAPCLQVLRDAIFLTLATGLGSVASVSM
jgi:hypothetical protein